MLAQRLDGVEGVRVIQDQRRRERRVTRQMRDRGKRSGQDRRVRPMLRGGFALVERNG
jgi:hypothetical protein